MKKLKAKDNTLCTCGHRKSKHYFQMNYSDCDAARGSKDGRSYFICDCVEFVQDNLALVEKLAKKRKLI